MGLDEVKIDDRTLEEASPDAAKPFAKVAVGDQVITVTDRKQLEGFCQAFEWLFENWKEENA